MSQDSSTSFFPFVPPHDESHKRVVASQSSTIGSSLKIDEALSSAVETAALRALKEGLSNIPHGKKSALVHAKRIQPDLVDDDHLMSFLRSEDFDVNLALERLVRYWEHRFKVFGPDKYTLPMTLDGAMKDYVREVAQSAFMLLPVLDGAGRAIIYNSSAHYNEEHSERKINVLWYILHVAMENPSAAKNGVIILANSKDTGLQHVDLKWILAACYAIDRDFPIRWKMAHVCHNKVFPLISSAVKAVLSVEQRKSFVLHNGSDERVLESLSEYSIPKNCVPDSLGGTLHVSREDFVQDRLAAERGASKSDNDKERPHSSPHVGKKLHTDATQQGINIEENVNKGFTNSQARSDMVSDTNQNDIIAEKTKAKSIIPNTRVSAPMPGEVQSCAAQPIPAQQKETDNVNRQKKTRTAKKDKPSSAHPGRTGDPRMKGAVQAKLDDPNLSLVHALLAGGFVFPDLDVPGIKLATVKDTNAVTVYQRRNQLLRRLRLVKEKAKKK